MAKLIINLETTDVRLQRYHSLKMQKALDEDIKQLRKSVNEGVTADKMLVDQHTYIRASEAIMNIHRVKSIVKALTFHHLN